MAASSRDLSRAGLFLLPIDERASSTALGSVPMTTTGVDRATSGSRVRAFNRPNPPAVDVPAATGGPPERAGVRTAEKSRSGPRGRGWARTLRRGLLGAALLVVAALAYLLWQFSLPEKLPDGFASSNGRIEATEIDVATKLAGRILDELVDEGDFVTAGQVVAHMDIETLQAQRREAVAKLASAKSAVETARSTLSAAREREGGSAVRRRAARGRTSTSRPTISPARRSWLKTGAMSKEDFDTRTCFLLQRRRRPSIPRKPNVAAADAAIATAKSHDHRRRGECRIRPGDDRTNPSGYRR